MKRGPKPCPVEERFWSKVQKTKTCWNWTASVKNGYGQISGEYAHRLSWVFKYGAVPEGLWVLHKCDNRRCVRPSHLFLGTHQDNVDDMWKKGRARPGRVRGSVHWRARLNERQVRTIIREVKEHGRVYGLQRRLARQFHVRPTAVANVLNGLTWVHLTGGRL